ncbi:MAG: short-chain dehydrogenase/reductase [Solirubrobacterales bacterium]|nr:short-chain dehydrogenase/reductase [Solirubrobacterales bacterium]
MRFEDQRIAILGGTSGLGLATAKAAAAEGAAVVVASATAARVEGALAQLPDSAEGHVVDLLDEDAVRGFFAAVGAIDHLAFTAGESLQLGLVAETSVADARRALDLRIWGAYTAVKHGAPRLREGGSIVLTSGSAGPRPGPGWGVGALICSGIEGWARAMALELAPLRVNVVRPGVIRTDLWDSMSEADRAGLYEGVAAQLPVSRVGEAEDVAAAYLYLMANAHSTGDVVTVDGGTLLV